MPSAHLLITLASSCKYITASLWKLVHKYFHNKPKSPKKWRTEREESPSSSCHRNKKVAGELPSNLATEYPPDTYFFLNLKKYTWTSHFKRIWSLLFLALHKQIKTIVPTVLSTVKASLYFNSSCMTDAPTLFSLTILRSSKTLTHREINTSIKG